jgi:hypothetical protein
MTATIHERFRLKPGMRIDLGREGTARVLRVSACAAVCQLERETVRDFTTSFGVPVHFAGRGQLIRISPNAEVPIL